MKSPKTTSQHLKDIQIVSAEKSQQHLKKIMDSSVDVICTIDKDGNFMEVSAASISLWGYSPDELTGKSAMNLLIEEDKDITIETGNNIRGGARVTHFINRYKHADGSVIPIVWSAQWDDEDQVMYCVARDGREMKKSRQDLQDQQTRLIRSQELAKLGSWEYDIQTNKTYWASDELYNIYGLKRVEVPEITVDVFLSLVHPDDLDILINDYSDINRLNNYYREHRLLKPDGSIIHIRQTMEVIYQDNIPIKLCGIVQDISDQKASEQLLLTSERRYRTLVQNGFDIVSIVDPDGNYLYVSDSILRILGHHSTDMISNNLFDFVHPDDTIKTAKALAKLYKQPFVEDIEPFRFRNMKGEWRWIESKGTNMLSDSSIKGLVINSRDVTDKKLLQERIEKEAQEWQKKLTSAAITAQEQERTQLGRELHDNVNQMLTTVKLYTELCLQEGVDTNVLLEKSSIYLSECINEIRSISKRLSTPIIEDISFAESIRDLVDSLNLTDKLNIHLNTKNLKKQLKPEVHLGIYRILQEQLTNIFKHAKAKNVFITISSKSKSLVLEVKDDGIGFEIDNKRRGIGINNMCARAESINASINFVTAPDAGCTLLLEVPFKKCQP